MSSSLEFPPVTGQDILNCSFSSWYAKYHRLSPRARIIKPLPEGFLTFLKSDGIVIPGEYIIHEKANPNNGRKTTSLLSEIDEIHSEAEVDTDEKTAVQLPPV